MTDFEDEAAFIERMYGARDESDPFIRAPLGASVSNLEDEGMIAKIKINGNMVIVPTLGYIRRLEAITQRQDQLITRLTNDLRKQKMASTRHSDEISAARREIDNKLDRRDTI